MTNPAQFEQFMRNYQNMVFSTALRLLASEAEAKDISQEVFLKAYERFAELETSPTAGGWLRTVATNLCLNHLTRYRNRWRFFSELTTRRIRRDSFQSVAELEAAIYAYLEHHNENGKPYVWTKSFEQIVRSINRCYRN